MGLTKKGLLKRLQGSITANEWEAIAHDEELSISGFNRRVLSELRNSDDGYSIGVSQEMG